VLRGGDVFAANARKRADCHDGRRTHQALFLASHVGSVVKEPPRYGPIKVIVLRRQVRF
jgi:hypothetical protein